MENINNAVATEVVSAQPVTEAQVKNVMTIIALSYLLGQGKKVAFVKGNRNTSSKNLNQKVKSIKESGQLMPFVIVDGKDADDEGLTLIDCETGLEVSLSGVENYVVILEGQHRYKANKMLQEEDKKNSTSFASSDIYVMYALNPKGQSIKKLISELNRTSIVWDGKDYITGAYLCNPTNELLKDAKVLADMKSTKANDDLPKNGYPLATISKYTTFGTGLTKDKLATSMDEGIDCLPTANLSRAERIIDAAIEVGFKHKYLAHKYLIDWIIDESNAKSEDKVCDMISNLKPNQVEAITKIKGDNYIAEIRKVVKGDDSIEEKEAA